jgi:hypothetical protein
MQIKPRKTKQIQEKVLGFSWIPFADSGLFNGLQRIQIKKIWFPFRVVFQTSQPDFPLFSSSPLLLFSPSPRRAMRPIR